MIRILQLGVVIFANEVINEVQLQMHLTFAVITCI